MPRFIVDTSPHELNFFDAIQITRGRGHILIDGDRHVVRPGIDDRQAVRDLSVFPILEVGVDRRTCESTQPGRLEAAFVVLKLFLLERQACAEGRCQGSMSLARNGGKGGVLVREDVGQADGRSRVHPEVDAAGQQVFVGGSQDRPRIGVVGADPGDEFGQVDGLQRPPGRQVGSGAGDQGAGAGQLDQVGADRLGADRVQLGGRAVVEPAQMARTSQASLP